MTASVLIIGASVAGIGAANELRRCGFTGKITLIDVQSHLPYDRPPLSKAALADAETAIHFHDAQYYRTCGIDLILGDEAIALDPATTAVDFASGRRVAADAIIVATGARARRLPDPVCTAQVHVVRDADDATTLRRSLVPGKHLVLIGGGFIGAEIAATASKLGLRVTIVDGDPLPLARVLGDEVARRVNALHRVAGIETAYGSAVTAVRAAGHGTIISLDNGAEICGDIVVAGLGARPNIEWLQTSDIALADGVVCDANGRTSRAGVFAAGDVAVWATVDGTQSRRHEHWTAAREQARIVAQTIAGDVPSEWSNFVPYFWSDIHGKRVQMLGTAEATDTVHLVFENEETGAFVAEYRRGERLVAVAGLNAAARVMRYATQLSESGAM